MTWGCHANVVIMKKLALILFFFCVGSMISQAQISTGESSASVFKTGNRAEKGDFGLYLGATTSMIGNLTDADCEFSALPLINLKYMYTENVEARLGIEWWKKSTTIDNGDYEMSESESSFMFYPGVAYHFSKSNILDVYVGGELPFGWGSTGAEYDGEDASASNFKVGLGAFIGLQAYVCNLPVAVGLEYGISAMYNTVSDGSLTNEGMTIVDDRDEKRFNLGNQARLTITYFFKM